MKFNDEITLDIAKVVQDVMEGKVKKEEVKYPHKMYHPENGKEVEVKDKAEHEKYAEKGYVHEKPTNEGPEEPRAKGEKDFKDKHIVKKSGEKEDGSVVKETTITIDEAKKPGRGKSKADIDWVGNSSDVKNAEKKHKVKIKSKGRGMADVSGEKKNIIAMLSDPEIYGMDDDDIEELFPELYESKQVELPEEDKENGYINLPEEELSDKQKEYQAFFQKALKKFDAESPADMDDEKKKEFFNYIDKNWKGSNEED